MSREARNTVRTAAASIAVVLAGCASDPPPEVSESTPASVAEGEMPGLARPTHPTRAVPSATLSPSPTAVEIPAEGTGRFEVASGDSDRVGSGRVVRYTVEVEGGLPYEPAAVASVVDATLADPRSWTAAGEYAFERTTAAADVRVLLATPATTDELCAPLRTLGEVSCRNGELVVVNARRWAYGVEAYRGDVGAYRQYVVNHEMGHAIGFGHTGCSGPGELAPVMHQQTFGLDGCLPNPWPHP